MDEIEIDKGPKSKALSINLDRSVYGSFAEIGAGQEVARYFFMAGAASGTIAKTMSAYDMAFSDSIYGREKTGRYVCQSRVQKMIDHEYALLQERLTGDKYKDTRFFAFANTVSAKNFLQNNECHGWLGFRFQLAPKAEPNDVIIHIRMLDSQNLLQQKAVGVMGVNLIHSCYNYTNDLDRFLNALMDELSHERIEIDMIHVKGPAFKNVDVRRLNLMLVEKQYTNAVIFDENGRVSAPMDVFYKKNVVVLRGSFKPPSNIHQDMIKYGTEKFYEVEGVSDSDFYAEMTLNHLTQRGSVDYEDFLIRADLLQSLGHKVMVSNYPQIHRLNKFLYRCRVQKSALIFGVYYLEALMEDEGHDDLDGGILESFGVLQRSGMRLYIYPALAADKKTILDANNVEVSERYNHLYQFLKDAGTIVNMDKYGKETLDIWSKEILSLLINNDPRWETSVPKEVIKIIRERNLYR